MYANDACMVSVCVCAMYMYMYVHIYVYVCAVHIVCVGVFCLISTLCGTYANEVTSSIA